MEDVRWQVRSNNDDCSMVAKYQNDVIDEVGEGDLDTQQPPTTHCPHLAGKDANTQDILHRHGDRISPACLLAETGPYELIMAIPIGKHVGREQEREMRVQRGINRSNVVFDKDCIYVSDFNCWSDVLSNKFGLGAPIVLVCDGLAAADVVVENLRCAERGLAIRNRVPVSPRREA